MSKLLVVIESPYAGETWKNKRYVRAAMADCLRRGEAPFASHALYTLDGVLDDDKPEERKLGMEAGFAWGDLAARTVVYVDRGVSKGMKAGIERAELAGRPVEFRTVPNWDDALGVVVNPAPAPAPTPEPAEAIPPNYDPATTFDGASAMDDGQPF